MTAPTRRFRGFAAGAHATVIPNTFFSDVLPLIDDQAELIVSGYFFYALSRRRASERWLSAELLAAELPLRRALQRLPDDPAAALARGLAAAVERGTLVVDLRAPPARYAVNSPAGRRGLALPVTESVDPVAQPAGAAPSIYALYEESIGTVSPLIAEELRAAEEDYASEWIEAAFREAAAQNRRSWRYVSRILQRWRDEGRHDAAVGRDPGAGRNLAGRYRGFVRR